MAVYQHDTLVAPHWSRLQGAGGDQEAFDAFLKSIATWQNDYLTNEMVSGKEFGAADAKLGPFIVSRCSDSG